MVFYFTGWVMIAIGILYVMFPSKKKYYKYGYRTARARASDASYRFAQKCAAKYFLVVGLITLAIGYILKLLGITHFFIIELLIIFIPVMMTFYLIEKNLEQYNEQHDFIKKGENNNETFND
ncbi:SdpI family protein [Vagococcus vulneris]|uniref:SdpI family protein n=1 Tax=Vagococcus vulneris TaxID=1977869 RepID=A0A430A2N2_9ENTE|nr:SdpI family protein [Vagococcus vulneris]RSU00701.1 hypothetical protein CBF37_01435 [Vagococcus vulneris]